jgi:hypothetical protein
MANKAGMKKLKVTTACVFAVWFIFAFFSARLPTINYFKAKKVNYLIHRHLPLGSTKAQTKLVLDKEAIENSLDNRPDGSAQLGAIIRGTSRGGLVTVDTTYIFSFDYLDKLDKILIEEIATGP